MKINGYVFPVDNHCEFLSGEEVISGQQWANECTKLAEEISHYSQKNWLLYEDDFYLYSRCFFALLIANKNIILAQSNTEQRTEQAALIADITIGNLASKHLPSFKSATLTKKDISVSEIPASTGIFTLSPTNTITLFTSGSSGEAKAIKKNWYQFVNEIEALADLFNEKSTNNWIMATVTHKHIYGLLFKLLWPVFTNQKIITDTIEYPEQAEYFAQKLTDILFISSPSYLSRATDQLSHIAQANIKNIFSSGGPLPTPIAHSFFSQYKQAVIEVYGSTETGGIAWRQQVLNKQWLLFPQHQVKLAPDSTLHLTSPFLAENTSIKTDDQVKLNGRYFELVGRVDRIIKLHEKRLSLDEMEQCLSNLSLVEWCHCTIISTNKDQLVTLIKLSDKSQLPIDALQKNALIRQLKSELLIKFEASLLPKKWRFVEEIPYNSQGKLVKAQIIELFHT